MRVDKSFALISFFVLFQSCFSTTQGNYINSKSQYSENNIFSDKNIIPLMEKVFHWQVNNPIESNEQYWNQWARSVFYSGVMYAYKTTKNEIYLNQTIRWGNSRNWKRGCRYRDADDLVCGHAYLDAYSVKKDSEMLIKIQSSVDSLITDSKTGREDWWWCDALFMTPPVLVRLGKITNDKKYYSYLDKMFWDTTDYLYSPSDSLFFRDKSYFNAKTVNGKKVFWSRGNAWVIGGLTQMLGIMPKNDPSRPKYLALYLKMISKIASLQQPDGLWRGSLLDPFEFPIKETSGSTLFAFAMAWGVNNGILSERIYSPKIRKAWIAIVQCINEEGKLGYVQPIGAGPETVKASDYQEYGSGFFLMAGSEMIKMAQIKEEIVKNKYPQAKKNVKTQSQLYNITKLVINP